MGNLRRIIGNAVSILTSDVLNRATTLVLYILVGRYLGAYEFGQLSLALTLFYAFQVFAVAGLEILVTREVAKDRTKTDQYLVNGSLIVVLSSLLSIIILLFFVRLMNYGAGTASIILLLSLGLIPYALSATYEAVFKAWEKMQFIAWANVPANVAKVVLAFLIMSRNYGLYELVIVLLASRVAIAVVEWYLIITHITRPRVKVDFKFCLSMVRATVTFLGIDGIIAIWASINIVLLSKFADETAVGLYSAANQLMVPVMLIYQSIVVSVFPMMCRNFEKGFQKVKAISEGLIELLLIIAFPSAVGLFFLADSALVFVYRGKEFLLASGALRIMVGNLILIAVSHGLGHMLLASLREKIALRIVAINALVNVVLGMILISQFGVIGAGVVVLLTGMVSVFQHYMWVSRLVSKIGLARLAWKPVVAATCMAVYLAVVTNQGVLLTVLSGGVVYAGVLVALVIWSVGGVGELRGQYLYILSE